MVFYNRCIGLQRRHLGHHLPSGDGLPLDVFPTSSLEMAFAVTRLLSSYTGDCMEVRRSSDDAVQDIGFLSDGTLDVDSLETFCGVGDGFVSKWYNQNGGGNNFVQATNSLQPQIVSSGSVVTGTKGNPSISYAASGVNLVSTGIFTLDPEGGTDLQFSVFFAARKGTTVGNLYAGQQNDTTFTIPYIRNDTTGAFRGGLNNVAPNQGAFYTAELALSEQSDWIIWGYGTQTENYTNTKCNSFPDDGYTWTNSTPTGSENEPWILGRRTDTASVQWDGEINLVVWHNRDVYCDAGLQSWATLRDYYS